MAQQFVETIKIKEGEAQAIAYHQDRKNYSAFLSIAMQCDFYAFAGETRGANGRYGFL